MRKPDSRNNRHANGRTLSEYKECSRRHDTWCIAFDCVVSYATCHEQCWSTWFWDDGFPDVMKTDTLWSRGAVVFVQVAREGARAVPQLRCDGSHLRSEQRLLFARLIGMDGAIYSMWETLGLDRTTLLPTGRGRLIQYLDPGDKQRYTCLRGTCLFEQCASPNTGSSAANPSVLSNPKSMHPTFWLASTRDCHVGLWLLQVAYSTTSAAARCRNGA
jgi:hypothetical protein